MKKQFLKMSWGDYYRCPGGDCGLTCCTSDWQIGISDEEIKMYSEMDHPFAEEIMRNIDTDKKGMKCIDGKCGLLDSQGFCKLVINCGDKYLSKTCTDFPWTHKDFKIVVEQFVELVCPVVADFLFEDKPIYFTSIEEEVEVSISHEEAEDYLSQFNARKRLIDVLQIESSKYIHGKIFITFKILEKMRELIEGNSLNSANVEEILDYYTNDNVVGSIFEQCEALNSKIEQKEPVIYMALKEIIMNKIFLVLFFQVFRHKPYVKKYFDEWIEDESQFQKDLLDYAAYMQKEYPIFQQNYLFYSLYCSWIAVKKEDFGNEFVARYIELLAIQLGAMAVLKEKGFLDRKEVDAIIASIDRIASHANDKFEMMYDYYKKKQEENPLFLLMLIIG